jgi:hypothetical protein
MICSHCDRAAPEPTVSAYGLWWHEQCIKEAEAELSTIIKQKQEQSVADLAFEGIEELLYRTDREMWSRGSDDKSLRPRRLF